MGSKHFDLIKSFKQARYSISPHPLYQGGVLESVLGVLATQSGSVFTASLSRKRTFENSFRYGVLIVSNQPLVVASLHKDLEEEFESLCTETKVGSVLDTLDQLIKEQSLDSLFLKKTNVMDVADNLSIAKKNEIECLTGMLEKAEKQNALIRACVEIFKSGNHGI